MPLRFHHYQQNPVFPIKDLLEKRPYYNIGILLMAYDGNFAPMLHFYGERNTFLNYKEVLDYSNVLRNVDYRTHPIGINADGHIVRPAFHVASALIAGLKDIAYMLCNESPDNSGEEWIKDYLRKDKIVEYYQ